MRWFKALLLMVCTGPLFGDDLGRVFSTAEQRAQLDQMRWRTETTSPVGTIMINGLLIRSSGHREVWLDGHAASRQTIDGVRPLVEALQPVEIPIQLDKLSRPVSVKPGQRIDVQDGTVYEGFAPQQTEQAAEPANPQAAAVAAPQDGPVDP